ncbi:isopeptide-forming domain-containing fimbrial protein [Collinsella aerofaciens]|uniref:isopeptide-forming domain-containing fimbrial protein n=1 Tax=Collinsella aerofaciens TaxID=74426 RepID=UPI001484F7C9|nr:isopeptide-forming domain-containing fimbrial protein [Collinsella aerofaciens]MDB1874851.1 isopeptide-forming domain-containing fimbrial protein [Collinsella aerofaciens]MDB1876662.1 isopeptide-forming domain-containing fimbrial protein [Collinsella aerofaciens]
MSKNIARLAVTAGLTAALSFGGVMAPASMAFAAEAAPANSITINRIAEDNKDNTFKAYQIFKAKVVDEKDKGKVASDIEWSSTTIGSKVIAAIQGSTKYKELVKADSTKALAADATAPVVAEWLSNNVTDTNASSASSSEGTRVAPGDVLYAIAAAVTDETPAGNGIPVDTSWTRPAITSDGHYGDGYYLFVSDGLKADKPNTGTSPIFAIVGGEPVTVTEKTSIPTVEKKVLNDSKVKDANITDQTGWEDYADSQIGQKVNYKLTGTIADNYATYDSYAYKFTDTLSQGLTYAKGSLEVYALNNESYTKIDQNSYTVVEPAEDNNNTLTVSFNDKGLKSATAANESDLLNIDAKTQIVVFYKAELNSKASYEAPGNKNEVYLEYSNNPMAEGTGKSEIDVVTDHVFRLDVTKTDKDTGSALTGKNLQAGFKVKVIRGDEGTLDNKWLGENGEIVEESQAYEFKTQLDDGKVYIPGLDTGTYQITETTTPTGYNTVAPFEITVTPSYKKNGELDTLTVSSNNKEMTVIKDANGATIPLTIKNKKGSGLPLTGLNGVTFTWIAGGAVLCIGVAHLIRSRKQAEESEQE